MLEKEALAGEIIETPNGNRYLILPNRKQAYIGNRELHRSEGLLEPREDGPCKLLGTVLLPGYED